MKVKILYPLTDDIMGTLSIQLSVSKEMQLVALRKGHDPDALQNLLDQEMQGIAKDIADCLGLEYDPEPE